MVSVGSDSQDKDSVKSDHETEPVKCAKFSRFGHYLPLIMPLLFIIFLSYYNLMLYAANNYAIFDLGLSYRTSLLFLQTHTFVIWTPTALVSGSPFTKLIYVPLSLTLLVYNSPATLLIDQILVIAAGGYAIQRIAKLKLKDEKTAYIIQGIYFLYPSTYGFMTHGGNFMVYFEGFFLLSYMFHIEGKKLKSALFVVLSGITNFTAPLLLALFYFIDFLVTRHQKWKRSNLGHREDWEVPNKLIKTSNNNSLPFLVFVLIFSAALLTFEISVYGLTGALTSTRIYGGSVQANSGGMAISVVHSIFSNFMGYKLTFFVELFAPLLFIPLLTPFSIPVLMFILAAWYSNYYPYYNVVQQYPFLIMGFMFLSVVYYLKKVKSKVHLRRIIYTMFVCVFAFFLVISSFNISNAVSGNISHAVSITNYEKELSHAYSVIPNNASVFVQLGPNVPFMNRAEVYAPGFYSNQSVDYAIINPNSYNMLTSRYHSDYYSSYWANQFALNSSYGVYESIQGATVYKLGYDGAPIYVVPAYYNNSLNIIDFTGNGSSSQLNSPQYTNFSPGTYVVRVSLELDKLGSSNSPFVNVSLTSPSGIQVMDNSSLSINSQTISYLNLTLPLTISTYIGGAFLLSLFSSKFVTLKSSVIMIKQIPLN